MKDLIIDSFSNGVITGANGTVLMKLDSNALTWNDISSCSYSGEIRANDIYSNGHKVITSEALKTYDEKIKEYITEQLNLIKDNKKQYIKMYDGEDY